MTVREYSRYIPAAVLVLLSMLPTSGMAQQQCLKGIVTLEGRVMVKQLEHPNGQPLVAYFLEGVSPFCYVGFDPEAYNPWKEYLKEPCRSGK